MKGTFTATIKKFIEKGWDNEKIVSYCNSKGIIPPKGGTLNEKYVSVIRAKGRPKRTYTHRSKMIELTPLRRERAFLLIGSIPDLLEAIKSYE